MILNNVFTRAICRRLYRKVAVRLTTKCSVAIGPAGDPYMLRWYLRPRNRWFNVYLHAYRHDDDDRALHDHPWWSLSFVLERDMIEVYRDRRGFDAVRNVREGSFVFRSAKFAHRLIIPEKHAVTIFVTGPRIREWGFLCPKGWRRWQDFVDERNTGQTGRGCD